MQVLRQPFAIRQKRTRRPCAVNRLGLLRFLRGGGCFVRACVGGVGNFRRLRKIGFAGVIRFLRLVIIGKGPRCARGGEVRKVRVKMRLRCIVQFRVAAGTGCAAAGAGGLHAFLRAPAPPGGERLANQMLGDFCFRQAQAGLS